MTSPQDSTAPFATHPKQFTQERARKTYEGLIAAAAELFAEGGFDTTQTPDIAAAAGVSVGTFYRYFDDKREVFLEVLRRFLADAYQDVVGRLTPERFVGRGQREAIDECLAVLVEHTVGASNLQRVFYEMALRDEEVASLRRRFDDEALSRITDIIALAVPADRASDPEAMAFVIQTAAVELAVGLSGMRGPAPVSKRRTLEALAALIEQALFPPLD